MHPEIKSDFVEVENVKIHYLHAGEGETILFIHGFPTSSYLWRNIMIELKDRFNVIAIDLPGYGKSEKNLSHSFSFRYYNRILTGFLHQLNLKKITLGVHDLGGPIGLYWMSQNMGSVNNLILFNTLVYPKFSWAVKLFGLATVTPILKDWLTSPLGIKKAIKIGVFHHQNLDETVFVNYQAPFRDKGSRKVLLKSVQRLSLKGFKEIESKLHTFKGPVQVIYGERDKILPNVGKTMKKVQQNLPQTKIKSIPNCSHFLQEDAPKEIAQLIDSFMNNN